MILKMKQPSVLVLIIGAAYLLVSTGATSADDKKPTIKPAVQFRKFPDPPPEGYRLTLQVEVEGADEKLVAACNTQGAISGAALANFFESVVNNESPSWKCSASGDKLIIEGWKNPNTGRIHPVKKIRVECPGLPKESMPIVNMPPKT